MKELVTVYIPTYNRLALLKRALESVRNQTYRNLEIIVVDDNSSDNTKKYLEEIAAIDTRISYYIKEENSGACESRNIAIKVAKGNFITGLDDDDYFAPDRIEKFISYWHERRNLDTVAIFSGSREIKSAALKGKKKRFLMKRRIIIKSDLLYANFVGNQVFTKTVLLQKLDGFDSELPMWQDFDMWYRLSELGNLENTLDPTYYLDTSHNYSRISNAKKNVVLKTAQYFTNKHNLNTFEQKILNNHLYHYQVISRDYYANFFKNIRKLIITIRSIIF